MQVFDAATGTLLFGFFPYNPAFAGGVRVAAADVNGDGVPDVITAPGPGGGQHVRVFDGAALQVGQVVELVGVMAYNPAFTGGVYIGAAAGASDTFEVVHHGGTFNAATFHINTETCPAGKRALAGGGSTDQVIFF